MAVPVVAAAAATAGVIVRVTVMLIDMVLPRAVTKILGPLRFAPVRKLAGAWRTSRTLYEAYERHQSVRWVIRRLGSRVTVTQKMAYYRGTLRRLKEYKNTWSRGVIGGFVNLNFVGDQPPVHHGNARVSLILHGRKIPMRPRRHRKLPPHIAGGARFRARLLRSVLGV